MVEDMIVLNQTLRDKAAHVMDDVRDPDVESIEAGFLVNGVLVRYLHA